MSSPQRTAVMLCNTSFAQKSTLFCGLNRPASLGTQFMAMLEQWLGFLPPGQMTQISTSHAVNKTMHPHKAARHSPSAKDKQRRNAEGSYKHMCPKQLTTPR